MEMDDTTRLTASSKDKGRRIEQISDVGTIFQCVRACTVSVRSGMFRLSAFGHSTVSVRSSLKLTKSDLFFEKPRKYQSVAILAQVLI